MQRTLPYSTYFDKVYGAFLGKTVIGTLGAPYEGIKMPLDLPFDESMINTLLPNDDLDLQILWLDAVRAHGRDFTSRDLLLRFMQYCPYDPGEYAIMRKNGKRGIWPPLSGSFSNKFYLEGMGCPIRSEIFACLFPLDPMEAADYSTRDGVIDHAGESVYAERFFAALEAEAFFSDDLDHLLRTGLTVIPEDCRIRRLILDTLDLCERYDDPKLILRKILFTWGHLDCTNLFENIAITLFALKKGELDPIKTGMIAINSGFDTDCTCATAGAIIGLMKGAKYLDERYGWHDVRYTLGVSIPSESDRVEDLAQEVARLGAHLNAPFITDAPITHYEFTPSLYPLDFSVHYENDDPTLSPVRPASLTLTVKNVSDAAVSTELLLTLLEREELHAVSLAVGQSTDIAITVSLPKGARTISETNLLHADYDHEGAAHRYTFGVVGITPWKTIGPIWRTDPICTTEALVDAQLQYGRILDAVPYDQNRIDVVRRFHLNCAIDTTTPYLTHDECFTPYDPAADTPYEERVFYQREDSFTFRDLCGFLGPAVMYLAREIVCPEDRTLCMQIGHASPFTLWLNGEKLAERDACDAWDAENVHLSDVKLHKGINRLLVRLVQVNEDSRFNVTLAKGIACAEHETDLASVLPDFFGTDIV